MDKKYGQKGLEKAFDRIISRIENHNEIPLYIQYAEYFRDNGFNVDKYLGELYSLNHELKIAN